MPTALKILRGNPGKRALPTDEPEPVVVEDTRPPPEWLDDAAKREWERVAPMLIRNGLLTEMDVDALTAYCQAYSTWKEASQKIKLFGMVIKGPNEFVMQSPYLPIANKALATVRAFMVEFGMTPSARTRVSNAGKKTAANPLERFINRRR